MEFNNIGGASFPPSGYNNNNNGDAYFINSFPHAYVNNNGIDNGHAYFNYNKNEVAMEYVYPFPPGYAFRPFEEELVVDYLMKKLNNQETPLRIPEVNLYEHHPQDLAGAHKEWGKGGGWYFFTSREKKYKNGNRPRRSARDGYWKATGRDIQVKHEGKVIGVKKKLAFHIGKQPLGVKTNWLMHEYRVADDNKPNSRNKTSANDDMKLDDCVLCKIYKKAAAKEDSKEGSSSGVPHNKEEEMGESEDAAYLNQQEQEQPKPNYDGASATTSAPGNYNNEMRRVYYCNGQAQAPLIEYKNVAPHANVQTLIFNNNVNVNVPSPHANVPGVLPHHLVQPLQQQFNQPNCGAVITDNYGEIKTIYQKGAQVTGYESPRLPPNPNPNPYKNSNNVAPQPSQFGNGNGNCIPQDQDSWGSHSSDGIRLVRHKTGTLIFVNEYGQVIHIIPPENP